MIDPFELCSGDRNIYWLVALAAGEIVQVTSGEVNYGKVSVKAFMLLLRLL